VDTEGVRVELVNLDAWEDREVAVQAGAFGEDRIEAVTVDQAERGYPGDSHDYLIPPVSTTSTLRNIGAARIVVELPPLTRISLRLSITRRAGTAAHRSFAHRN
jgi:hypothetical protein